MPYLKNGVLMGINSMREGASEQYKSAVPIIENEADISVLANPVMEFPEVMNEFAQRLISRIAYTQYEAKRFNSPLKGLEGDAIPFGYVGQEIHVNPAKGRKFDSSDFAGLLKKYESDVKVQYLPLNMDLQYPVTLSRQQLKTAFISWDNLESLINEISNSLYNGAYIDEYKFTKNIVSSAYMNNRAIIQQVAGVTDLQKATDFVKLARRMFLDFASPSSKFNAWTKCGGEGRPVITWTDPSEIIMIVRNDIAVNLDVDVLAKAYNIDRTTLMGNIINVDNFDVYNDEGEKIFDGSPIQGIICDKKWFRIKMQDMFMGDFKNDNNRTWQYFLNIIKMYQFSLFANGVILATSLPPANP